MIVLLNIPRTSMRPVHNVVSNQGIKNFAIMSPKDFHSAERASLNEDVHYYFIIRDPIERVMREYFMEERKCSLKEYFVDESLHNVTCKFILRSTDPITDESFEKVLQLVNSEKFTYDIFHPEKTHFTNLKKLTGIDMYEHHVTNEYKLHKSRRVFTPHEIHFMLSELNKYDIKLFEILNTTV